MAETSISEQDAFQLNTGELMLAISKDREKHPGEKVRTVQTQTTEHGTSAANKIFGFAMALFIGLAAAVVVLQA